MNLESALELHRRSIEQRDRVQRILTAAEEAAARAQRTLEAAKDHYAGAVSLVLERERLVRELTIEANGGHHP